MRFTTIALLTAAVAVAAFIAVEFWRQEPAPVAEHVTRQAAPPPPPVEPTVRYPVPDLSQPQPAENGPSTGEPEGGQVQELTLRDYLQQLVPQTELYKLLLPDDFIPRLVVTIDNLPRKTIPRQHLPLRPPQGSFMVTGPEDAQVISEHNFARYTPYVRLAEAISIETLSQIYFRLYPLFQQTYQRMGYPNGYFNDRLIAVLDHLLATPEYDTPLPVEHHVNRYVFANPDLEARSAGQKILLRMGPDNARRVKDRLQALRTVLAQADQSALNSGSQ